MGVPLLSCGYALAAEAFLARLGVGQRDVWRPWLWLAPAALLLGGLLVYPVLRTVALSFMDAGGTGFAGFRNYLHVFGDRSMLLVLRNNLRWLLVFPVGAGVAGLAIAVLADRMPYEKVLKSVVFMPAAISLAVAGVLWRFMYQYQPAGMAQTGSVNALLCWMDPGFTPRAWLFDPALNNGALIAGMIWIQAGYAMVLFSASLKNIPEPLLEAARLEGAHGFQVFFKVVLPLMKSTVVVVLTTYVVIALKVFDFVYVTTSGTLGTDVIGNRMYKEMFIYNHYERASTLAVVMLLAILPVMIMNIRSFGKQGRSP
ncbi:MAG: sugar ABC transporter permease [Holophaga sp.]|nr:sugar ABC transporter permease [Holophaga sp.]